VSLPIDPWFKECERIDISPTTMWTYRGTKIRRIIRPKLTAMALSIPRFSEARALSANARLSTPIDYRWIEHSAAVKASSFSRGDHQR
jgi:hypothetical protein